MNKIVISASRRTDIPAFYMEWFMSQIEKGFFENINPFNRRISIISAIPDKIHTVVFWSKNFGHFIKGQFGSKIKDKGYNLFFNFTINSISNLLEPNVISLEERIEQLYYLCDCFGARSVQWRFDPICFFKKDNTEVENNLEGFSKIAEKASNCGVQRCITSFMDFYFKIKKRTSFIQNFSFVEPLMADKIKIILDMEKILSENNIQLYTCCEKELLNSLPDNSKVKKSSCIPNDLLIELFGGELSLKKDTGQRIKAGCGCKVSVDIGDYNLHPCYHNCLYCYANPL